MSATNQFMCVALIVDFILKGLIAKITPEECGKPGIILTKRYTIFFRERGKYVTSIHPSILFISCSVQCNLCVQTS